MGKIDVVIGKPFKEGVNVNVGNKSGDKNIIEEVQVNGSALPVVDKAVNVPVPTNVSQLDNDSGFITAAVNSLVNYYLKGDADALFATIAALNAEVSRATGVEDALQGLVDAIVEKIPAQASADNPLADKAFVNSSIATATAEFKGTYNSVGELPVTGVDNNDYAFVRTVDAAGNTVYKRYKYNGSAWVFEYDLNNSSFTSEQWAAVNSGITAALVSKLSGLPNADALTALLAGKQDTISDLESIRRGAAAGASAYQKPSTGIPAADLSEDVQASLAKAANPPTEVFWATYGETTAAEIDAAITAGKIVMCEHSQSNSVRRYVYSGNIYGSVSYNFRYLASVVNDQVWYIRVRDDNNQWSDGVFILQNSNMRLSSWQSTPDDSHYPSEKLVKDSLDAKADKASSPTAGDLAKLDANGNLADSGLTPNMLSLFLDMDKLTPLEVIEYDVNTGGSWTLFERDNSAGTLASEAVETIACRLTTTGTNLTEPQVVDLVAFLPGQVNAAFSVLVNAKTPNTIAANRYGIYQMQVMYPKAIGSGYGWGVRMDARSSASVTRHIKVEVFKTADTVTFSTSKVDTYNSAYYNLTGARQLQGGIRSISTLYTDINGTSIASSYINGYLNSFIPGAPAVAGEALSNQNICFFSTDNKLYKISATNVPIFADAGTHLVGNNYSAEQDVGYTHLRQKAACTIANSSATYGTFAKGEEIYLRCHLSNGVLYSDGVLTNAVATGYTWISVGKAASATQLALDTVGKQFFTLDSNGKLTHINGREIAGGSAAGGTWGSITGTLADQTDLASALAGKQPTIDASHKLDYSLLSNTPTIPTVEALTTSEIDTIWSSN